MAENTPAVQVWNNEPYRNYDNGYTCDPWTLTTTGAIRGDVHAASREITNSIHNASLANARDFCEINGNIHKAECDLTERIGNTERGLSKAICDTEARVTGNITETRLEQMKGFAEVKLQACETENRLSRQLADCCCHIETMLKDNEISRLKDELAGARNELLLEAKLAALKVK